MSKITGVMQSRIAVLLRRLGSQNRLTDLGLFDQYTVWRTNLVGSTERDQSPLVERLISTRQRLDSPAIPTW